MTRGATERTCRCGAKFMGRGRALWCSDSCRKRTLYGGACAGCGAPTSGGKGRTGRSTHCRTCAAANDPRVAVMHERDERMIEMRERGMLNHEIADELGLSTQSVAGRFLRLRDAGVEVPPSPYNRGATVRTAEQRSETPPPERRSRRSVKVSPRCVRCDIPMREPAPDDLCGLCVEELAQR